MGVRGTWEGGIRPGLGSSLPLLSPPLSCSQATDLLLNQDPLRQLFGNDRLKR